MEINIMKQREEDTQKEINLNIKKTKEAIYEKE